jgi:hypothetical protein
MTVRTFSPSKILVPVLIAFLLLSCSIFSPTVQPTPAPTLTIAPSPTATTAVHAPLPEKATQTPVSATIDSIQVDYIYTSNLITILYPLYGSKLDDFAVITIQNQRTTPAKVVVTSEITGYTTPAINTLTVAGGETAEVRQNPRLIPAVLDQLNTEKPAQFHLRVVELDQGVEKLILEDTGDTLVYARRDFPLEIPGFTFQEVFKFWPAMVTPNDPRVEELIRKAADYTKDGTMWNGYGGYANDETGGVWDRLQAIWQAEDQDYQLTYISTMESMAPGAVQRIRLPGEVLDQHSGNCIETSMLFAAAAEALKLETVLVGVPGHAFVGVRMDQENANYYFIETTLIGRTGFKEAVDAAAAEFEDALPHLDAQEDPYRWVSIWDARADGILPLPLD